MSDSPSPRDNAMRINNDDTDQLPKISLPRSSNDDLFDRVLDSPSEPLSDNYIYRVDHFRDLVNSKRSEKLISQPFKIDGFRWQILFFPMGNQNGGPNNVSMFVQLLDIQSYPPNTEHKFKFTVIPPDGSSRKPHTKESKHRFTTSEDDRGFGELISISSALLYVHPPDDSLVIKVELTRAKQSLPDSSSNINRSLDQGNNQPINQSIVSVIQPINSARPFPRHKIKRSNPSLSAQSVIPSRLNVDACHGNEEEEDQCQPGSAKPIALSNKRTRIERDNHSPSVHGSEPVQRDSCDCAERTLQLADRAQELALKIEQNSHKEQELTQMLRRTSKKEQQLLILMDNVKTERDQNRVEHEKQMAALAAREAAISRLFDETTALLSPSNGI